MPNRKLVGPLERCVMEQLWSGPEPQTVRNIHLAISVRRDLAYTTVMTVLRRLADKGLVVQYRNDRAYRYAAVRGPDELVAESMLGALDEIADSTGRCAALAHFVDRVGAANVQLLQQALAKLETDSDGSRRVSL
ncbi:BlaI/MecI/CopY family transcriptional regulator [Mycobacterium sp. Aquia_213]|uniref:BlaI/MecI/CopY family transcriptional regulator n=1 Tax=Mycobacterium sp. Aquia_213 TaxID=2991728 RepID=UPI0022710263|nr:BlaI/MecI/CopY family transcriptional regulator [Mycobacterium sp. Aquia_213]WAC89249.1 BlaI/MecI/CopY family transcriptional regulator [Mycobacterium sp. Aquia_213]